MTLVRDLPIHDLEEGILTGDRTRLAKAITLIESRRETDVAQAQDLLTRLAPRQGNARRLAITGPPGAGKSTLIETLGQTLTGSGQHIAVLAIDPSSARTGGSILGDKTRMTALAADTNAFIRPSPSGGVGGGVGRASRETIALCDAAGFNTIILETTGVGQSETAAADMVDFLLVLLLPGAGDELQGIKRGLMECADMVAITKADGDTLQSAQNAAASCQNALAILRRNDAWSPPVITCSALQNQGIGDIISQIEKHHQAMTDSGELAKKRADQQVRWMHALLEERLLGGFRSAPDVAKSISRMEKAVAAGTTTPVLAVQEILKKGLGSP